MIIEYSSPTFLTRGDLSIQEVYLNDPDQSDSTLYKVHMSHYNFSIKRSEKIKTTKQTTEHKKSVNNGYIV